MYYFASKVLLHGRDNLRAAATQQTLGLLRKQPCIISLLLLSSSKPMSTNANQDSKIVSFLINSCGLSPKSALTVSKKVHFRTLRNPKLVLSFFENHGFSHTQVSKIIEKAPTLFLCRPEKTLLPKFEFFLSIGISSSDLVTLVYTCPGVLTHGLDTKIVTNYKAIEELFKSRDKATAAIKRLPVILCYNIEGTVANLRGHGVPDANIALLIRRWPHLLMSSSSVGFNKSVEIVREMGFSPMKSTFVMALVAMRANGKAKWEKKLNLYKSWGLSEEQIFAAFAKFPGCMIASEGKISTVMDFFVNKMGWEASALAERPKLVALSLEKRILPRASVIQFLISEGLLKPEVTKVATMLIRTENDFKKMCLTRLKDDPQLLELYKEKFDLCKVTQATE